ncbi:MAG: glycosyltransferase, partial [Clostridiales Family XIII bacterium]|nr:glycosyltransferase [Clostridiales Family XIII bacterium]
IKAFHLPYLQWFKKQGYETFVAANSGDIKDANGVTIPVNGQDLGADIIPFCDHKYNIDIQRSPFSLKNIRASLQLKRIMDINDFTLIHGHTPVGGVLTRVVGKKYRKYGLNVLYTAHGFQFYSGGPKVSWMIFYPIEKFLSRFTDGLITINNEDYDIAKTKFHSRQTYLISGVGYDEKRFYPRAKEDCVKTRIQMGYSSEELLLIYVAELSKRKNQGLLLEVVKKVRAQHKNVRLLLVGRDGMDGFYQTMAKQLGVDDIVDFLGPRNDVDVLIPMCDINVASSLNEGQGINILEAMASGVPVVATTTKGHKDLIRNGESGFLIPWEHVILDFSNQVLSLIYDHALCHKLIQNGLIVAKEHTKQKSVEEMDHIYNSFS